MAKAIMSKRKFINQWLRHFARSVDNKDIEKVFLTIIFGTYFHTSYWKRDYFLLEMPRGLNMTLLINPIVFL